MRIGYGWDSHEFKRGLPLVIGGVPLPHSHGLAGHSDGDVLLHALTDALLPRKQHKYVTNRNQKFVKFDLSSRAQRGICICLQLGASSFVARFTLRSWPPWPAA